MLRWEVVERRKDVSILGEATARRLVFGAVFFEEVVEGFGCCFAGVGQPELVKVTLRLRLESLGHLVEHVGRLVNPAPLLLGRVPPPHETRFTKKGLLYTDGPGQRQGQEASPVPRGTQVTSNRPREGVTPEVWGSLCCALTLFLRAVYAPIGGIKILQAGHPKLLSSALIYLKRELLTPYRSS